MALPLNLLKSFSPTMLRTTTTRGAKGPPAPLLPSRTVWRLGPAAGRIEEEVACAVLEGCGGRITRVGTPDAQGARCSPHHSTTHGKAQHTAREKNFAPAPPARAAGCASFNAAEEEVLVVSKLPYCMREEYARERTLEGTTGRPWEEAVALPPVKRAREPMAEAQLTVADISNMFNGL